MEAANMHRIFHAATAALALAWTAGVSAQQSAVRIERLDPGLDAVVAPGTNIERVATGFTFTEGPLWDRGKLWFSDVRADKLRTLGRDGKVTVVIDNAGGAVNPPPGGNIGPNGMAPAADGTILLVQMGARRISRIDSHMRLHPFLSSFHGKRLNSPNDLVYARDGSLWFTDPPFGLAGMDKDPAKELPINGVYRYAKGKVTAVITNLTLPNGIGFSPDWKTLYVSNSGPDRFVRAYDVKPDGRVSNPRDLIHYPAGNDPDVPDGLKVDQAGNVWTTGPGGIRIISPAGRVLGQIKLPEVAANLAFAEDGHTVYITASTSVYRLHTKVKGELPLHYRR
jgi:gluconolactonase